MEVNFPDDDSKKKFLGRLEKAKGLLSSGESHVVVDNFRLLSSMLDHFEEAVEDGAGAVGGGAAAGNTTAVPMPSNMILKDSGIKYIYYYKELLLLI